MKRIILLGFLMVLGSLIFANDFSYEDYKFLTENEWQHFYDYEECGEVKIIPYKKGVGQLAQRKWWNGSYDLIEITSDDEFTKIGKNLFYKIRKNEYTNYIDFDCLNGIYSSSVCRPNENVYKSNILGVWNFSNSKEFKFEIREIEQDDYVFLIYIEGLVRPDVNIERRKYFYGWFLLKYRDKRNFVTDGAFEKDNYRLYIDSKNLYFIPEFESERKRYEITKKR